MATIIVIVIVLVILAVAATLAGTTLLRRRALQHRFGAEYDQLARDVGPRRAQAELAERQRRVAKLDIRELSAERRAGYTREWTSLQERFVDNPAESVAAAAALVSSAAADRGYPAGDGDRLRSDLSVDYADRLDGYRQAQRVTAQAGTAGTEELRQALLGYGALFRDLIGVDPGAEWPVAATEPASGASVPAAATARNSQARASTPAGDETDVATTPDGDETEVETTPDGDETDVETTPDGDENWTGSGDQAAAPAARKD
jgi:hypothetical protein